MKHILILSTLALMLSTKTNAQIPIGKCSHGAYTSGELSYKITGTDTIYTLNYRDFQYSSTPIYDDLIFKGNSKTIDDLYKLMKSVFNEENVKNKEYSVKITLGNQEVKIGTYRFMGMTMSQITTSLGWGYFNSNQLDKLFGKTTN